jgi:hypothetical protein
MRIRSIGSNSKKEGTLDKMLMTNMSFSRPTGVFGLMVGNQPTPPCKMISNLLNV